jgi:hypothetical protein
MSGSFFLGEYCTAYLETTVPPCEYRVNAGAGHTSRAEYELGKEPQPERLDAEGLESLNGAP